MTMEQRVAEWVVSKIGIAGMDRRERALRLLEEAVELAQAEGITLTQVARQVAHVYERPAGDPEQEAGGVAVCLLGWCAATDTTFADVAEAELARIEAKPIDEIRGSLSRKHDADLVTIADSGTPDDQVDPRQVAAGIPDAFWILLSRIYPAIPTWACWFRWSYNLRIWVAGKAYGAAEYRIGGGF